MKKKAVKNTAKNTTHLLFAPERKVINAESAMKMGDRCSEYNSSRSDARNFRCMAFNGITFKDQDLSGVECQYSIFTDCIFESVNLNRLSAEFATFQNCQWRNCCLENANFSFATISDSNFYNCGCTGADFPFCHGNFAATSCLMERVNANNSSLHLVLTSSNCVGFEANCSHLRIEISGSNFSRAEFNDSEMIGEFENTNLTDAQLNRSDLSQLHIAYDCATHGMAREDSTGDEIDCALDQAIHELEDVLKD